MVFCNKFLKAYKSYTGLVTILILVDGFLQSVTPEEVENLYKRHNPYFSRWFSAMLSLKRLLSVDIVTILILVDGFLQFSHYKRIMYGEEVTILILVDGFLQ